MLITKVEVQKNHKNYFNLYTGDDVYLFSITEETLLNFNIAKNKDFNDEELESIQKYDQKMRCVYQAYRFLSRRPHLKEELRRKLSVKGYLSTVIDDSLHFIEKKKYLDDAGFIKMFINDQINLKKNGPLIIKKKLLEKGARADQIDPALESAYSEDLQIKNADYLFKNKIKSLHEQDALKLRNKLYRFLQQKGFNWPVIEKVFAENFGQPE
ncbi:MAG: RecX family transcriptional regulator [Calditrichaceae bacterium]